MKIFGLVLCIFLFLGLGMLNLVNFELVFGLFVILRLILLVVVLNEGLDIFGFLIEIFDEFMFGLNLLILILFFILFIDGLDKLCFLCEKFGFFIFCIFVFILGGFDLKFGFLIFEVFRLNLDFCILVLLKIFFSEDFEIVDVLYEFLGVLNFEFLMFRLYNIGKFK